MREQPPEAGIRPMFASGKPMRAERAMIRKSDAMQISRPSPTAVPLMAEITGLGSVSRESRSALVAKRKYIGAISAALANSSSNCAMSAPAEKALSPVPVKITARILGSAATSVMAARISSSMAMVTGFIGGRLRVMSTMPGSGSSHSRVSNWLMAADLRTLNGWCVNNRLLDRLSVRSAEGAEHAVALPAAAAGPAHEHHGPGHLHHRPGGALPGVRLHRLAPLAAGAHPHRRAVHGRRRAGHVPGAGRRRARPGLVAPQRPVPPVRDMGTA